MPPKKVDPHNADQLNARITELTVKLRKQNRKAGRLRAAYLAVLARKQKLAAWRATRRKQLAALSHGPAQAVREALKCVGQTENPAGSNKGPGIVSLCQKELLGYDGVAWCGCFGAYFLKHFGGVKVTSRMAYCPYNVADAQQAQKTGRPVNGWKGIRTDKTKGQLGDCAMMDWQHDGTADHFVILIRYLGGGWYETVEGNTSFDNAGSQSNGGCVADKKRHVNDMQAICIPAYA